MMRNVARLSNAARSFWRGWDEQDIVRLGEKLYDPAAYRGGVLRITEREYRALPEYNRRILATTPGAVSHPLLVWVGRRGLRQSHRAGKPS
jgi:hypothetical protein